MLLTFDKRYVISQEFIHLLGSKVHDFLLSSNEKQSEYILICMIELLQGLCEMGKEIMADSEINKHYQWCEQDNTKIPDVNVYQNTFSAKIDRYWYICRRIIM
jgi:hypothetical protein